MFLTAPDVSFVGFTTGWLTTEEVLPDDVGLTDDVEAVDDPAFEAADDVTSDEDEESDDDESDEVTSEEDDDASDDATEDVSVLDVSPVVGLEHAAIDTARSDAAINTAAILFMLIIKNTLLFQNGFLDCQSYSAESRGSDYQCREHIGSGACVRYRSTVAA